jgi:BirA family transcriptional regulator, biotin operon repressor / biotin---[acetyl-CoA-carboxylase] ligase
MLSPLGFALLRRLADGELHSGEALAAATGVTRARVSQILRASESAGFTLERVRGVGYRLIDPVPFLDRGAIVAALGAAASRLKIEVADSVDSTSSELLRRSARQSVDRQVLVTEWQTAGRGRRGRAWSAVAGGSLTFSLGWRFEQGAGFLAGLSLAVGVALCRALDKAGFKDVQLKWPNDLVHRHCKIGGILIEISGDALGPALAIIGVGLNVRLPAAARRDIDQPVSDLAAIDKQQALDRNRLLAFILVELVELLERYAHNGFAPLVAEWQRRHALQKKPVRVLLPDGSVAAGDVVGVDASGALVLDQRGRRVRFVSGEVSLRRG